MELLQAYATLDGAKWKMGDARRQGGRDRMKETFPRQRDDPVVCFRIPAPRALGAAGCTDRMWIERREAVIHSSFCRTSFFFSGGAARISPSSACPRDPREAHPHPASGSGDEDLLKNCPL
ncbi:unnamed protein product [Lampetra planeri]